MSMKSMKPWVALPGACRLSRVTSERHPSRSPFAIHSTALASNSGSGPRGPNWRGPASPRGRRPGAVRPERPGAAEVEGQVAGADDRDALVARPRLDELAQQPAQLDEALRQRERRRE